MRSLKSQSSKTTRRSAGLPSLIVGILSANPSGPLFNQAISDLVNESGVATHETTLHGDPLPQVHALNCLRAVFVNTVLGQYTEPHVGSVLSLAGQCLTSDIWAIRNCGLILFRALIDRLLGSSDSQNWSEKSQAINKPRFSYGDFPDLLEIVLELLSPDSVRLTSAQNALESVFPALKLIQRMPPPQSRHAEVRVLVLRLCQSPHWHVREMAAKTFVGLIAGQDTIDAISGLVPSPGSPQNLIHGRLLCVAYLAKREMGRTDWRDDGMADLESILIAASWLCEANTCPFTKALYLDILNSISLALINKGSNDHGFDLDGTAVPMSSQQKTGGDAIPGADVIVMSEAPAVRKSMALHRLLQYIRTTRSKDDKFAGSYDELTSLDLSAYLQALIKRDTQSFEDALDTLMDKMSYLPPPTIGIIADVLCSAAIGTSDESPHALAASRRLLLRLYEALGRDGDFFGDKLTSEHMSATMRGLKSLPPSLVQSTILLWGPLLNEACADGHAQPNLRAQLTTLQRSLRVLLDEGREPDFDLRMAVARCLLSMPNIWKTPLPASHIISPSLMVEFILLVYDLLNDDDIEIRSAAASITSKILSSSHGTSGRVKDTVPLLAGQRLSKHVFTHYTECEVLIKKAVSKMLNLGQYPVANQAFSVAKAERTELFATEKQNLNIDLVREVAIWSDCLKNIPRSSCSRLLVETLHAWLDPALSLLLQTTETEYDGPLGRSSKPEMFVFGMQAWRAADVILTWRRRFSRNPAGENSLTRRLLRILKQGNEQKLHPLWLVEIERVLASDIKARLKGSVAGRNVEALSAVLGESVG